MALLMGQLVSTKVFATVITVVLVSCAMQLIEPFVNLFISARHYGLCCSILFIGTLYGMQATQNVMKCYVYWFIDTCIFINFIRQFIYCADTCAGALTVLLYRLFCKTINQWQLLTASSAKPGYIAFIPHACYALSGELSNIC